MNKGCRHMPLIHSFIHCRHFYCASSSPLLLRGVPDYSTDTVSEFHAEATGNLSKGLAQGPYVATTAGFESMTLRLKVIDLTNVPPEPSAVACTPSTQAPEPAYIHVLAPASEPSIVASTPSTQAPEPAYIMY